MNVSRVRRVVVLAVLATLVGGAAMAATRWSELDEGQRAQLRDLRERLDEQGADRATCRAEHDKLFRSWGLEPPAGPPEGRGRGPCGKGMGAGRGAGSCRAAAKDGAGASTARDDGPTGSPSLGLGNHPNPFNPETTIRFQLPEPATARLDIFDLQGARVRSLELGRLEAGAHQTVWDGLDSQGKPAASGTYLYRLELPGRAETGRMTLLR